MKESANLIKQALEKNGVRVLTNECVLPNPEVSQLQIIGIPDCSSDEFDPVKAFEPLTVRG
jgi:hypothetical protein